MSLGYAPGQKISFRQSYSSLSTMGYTSGLRRYVIPAGYQAFGAKVQSARELQAFFCSRATCLFEVMGQN